MDVFSLKTFNWSDEAHPHYVCMRTHTHPHFIGSISLENPNKGFLCFSDITDWSVSVASMFRRVSLEHLFIWLGWRWRTSPPSTLRRGEGKPQWAALSQPHSTLVTLFPSPLHSLFGWESGIDKMGERGPEWCLGMAVLFRMWGSLVLLGPQL